MAPLRDNFFVDFRQFPAKFTWDTSPKVTIRATDAIGARWPSRSRGLAAAWSGYRCNGGHVYTGTPERESETRPETAAKLEAEVGCWRHPAHRQGHASPGNQGPEGEIRQGSGAITPGLQAQREQRDWLGYSEASGALPPLPPLPLTTPLAAENLIERPTHRRAYIINAGWRRGDLEPPLSRENGAFSAAGGGGGNGNRRSTAARRAALPLLRLLSYESDPGSNVDRRQADALTLKVHLQPCRLEVPHYPEPFCPRTHMEFFLFTAQQAQHGRISLRQSGHLLNPGQAQAKAPGLKLRPRRQCLFPAPSIR